MKELICHKLQHDFKRIKPLPNGCFSPSSPDCLSGCWHTLLFRHVCGHTDQNQNPWLIFLLPVSGILIVGCYRLLHDEKDTGTNLVLSAIHSDEDLPLRMAPLILSPHSSPTCLVVLPDVKVLRYSSVEVSETVLENCSALMKKTNTL